MGSQFDPLPCHGDLLAAMADAVEPPAQPAGGVP